MNKKFIIALALAVMLICTACSNNFFEGKSVQGENKPIPQKFSLNQNGIDKIDAEGIKIFDALMKEKGYKKNFILSPISIQKLLDLIAMGVSDRTSLKALSLYDNSHLQEMMLANSKMESLILLNKDILKGVKIEKIPFDNVKFTEFPNEATNEKMELQKRVLDEIIDKEELSADTSVALMDAIHYYSEWIIPFEKNATKECEFTTANGEKIKVPTMYNKFSDKSAISDADKDIFALPAKNNATVYFIKPKKNIEITSAKLQALIEEYKEKSEVAEVDFYLPKVDFKVETDLINLFDKIGLSKLVTGFEFDRFIPQVRMFISKAKQVATLRVDEKGAEAKAITTIEIKNSMRPIDKKMLTIKMDSPYYIVISDNETTTDQPIIIFTAYVANPIEK